MDWGFGSWSIVGSGRGMEVGDGRLGLMVKFMKLRMGLYMDARCELV